MNLQFARGTQHQVGITQTFPPVLVYHQRTAHQTHAVGSRQLPLYLKQYTPLREGKGGNCKARNQPSIFEGLGWAPQQWTRDRVSLAHIVPHFRQGVGFRGRPPALTLRAAAILCALLRVSRRAILLLGLTVTDQIVDHGNQAIQFVIDLSHHHVVSGHRPLVLLQPFSVALQYFRLPRLQACHYDSCLLQLFDCALHVHGNKYSSLRKQQ